MIRSTFGAPFGGTIFGAHHGFESFAPSLMTPPNFGGGGSWFPLIVVVALGEPGVPGGLDLFCLKGTSCQYQNASLDAGKDLS